MAYITAAEREAIPLADFAWPEKRKYPITSQGRFDAAIKLIGLQAKHLQPRLRARAIAIAKRKGYTLPETAGA